MPVDHWEGEDVIITFEEEGKDSVLTYSGKITKISVSGGADNVETFFAFGNATIAFNKPREKFNVAFDLIFSDARFSKLQFGGSAHAAGVEYRSSMSKLRQRVVVWFVPAANQKKNASTGAVVPKKTGEIYRWIFADCRAVTFDREMSADETLRGTITFEFSSTDDNAYANFFDEWTSSQASTALTVLTATAHKGTLTWNTTTPAWTGSYRT